MAIFETKDLVIRTKKIEAGGYGTFLEISFEGVHVHHWPAGCDFMSFIEGEIRAAAPAACLIDFLQYDYSFGNEIVDPIFAPWHVFPRPPIPPVAVVAQGGTASSLKSLFVAGKLDKLPDLGLFETGVSGYAFLRDRLDRRADPLSPG